MIHPFQKLKRQFPLTIGLIAVFLLVAACQPDHDDPINRDAWVGSWICVETAGESAPQSYAVHIEAGTQPDAVRIRGLANSGSGFILDAFVYDYSIEIPQQTEDGIDVSGSGNMNAAETRIDIGFILNDGSGDDHVVAYMTK